MSISAQFQVHKSQPKVSPPSSGEGRQKTRTAFDKIQVIVLIMTDYDVNENNVDYVSHVEVPWYTNANHKEYVDEYHDEEPPEIDSEVNVDEHMKLIQEELLETRRREEELKTFRKSIMR